LIQMGMPVNTSLKLADDARSLEAENPAALQLAEFNPRNRIEYRLLDTQYELETYNMRRFKMGYLPSLYGTASYQLSTQFEELSTAQSFDVGTVGLQLSIPVFDGFRKKHQIQQSKLAMQKIANSKDDLLNSFDLELKNTQAQLENAYANMEAYQRNVDLAEKVFRVSQEKYKEGVGSSLEVNDADSQLKQAQTNYLNGLFEYLDTRVEYQKARGDFSKYHFN
jgi:outer membrane protein TolC